MTMRPIPTYAEALAQLDVLRAQVVTLVRLLKEREHDMREDVCVSCGVGVSVKHKPECELALALRSSEVVTNG